MPEDNNPVIEVIDLSASYGHEPILHDINFKVNPNEVFAVLGGSGCGKSTLLKHITGLYCPVKGDIIIHGESIVKASGDKRREIMRSFGVTYQGGALWGSLTVGENVSLPLEEYTSLSRKQIRAVVDEKLHLVQMDGFRDYMPAELSGGMRKRAGLARAMALSPKLLFFDEPSAGLDPITSARLDELILRLRDECDTTIMVVTHELDSIFTIADRVIMLSKETKSIVAEGDPRYLRDKSPDPWVREFMTRGASLRLAGSIPQST
ncbi:MAG: polyamine ABC transporter ATP-binding protein [Lentisphaerae bacterium GWF2_52_8]|nr:MAG: polyamine ABC transporter ATP-binding protein [Lentisphaerae bacterium GWF2_52_8]